MSAGSQIRLRFPVDSTGASCRVRNGRIARVRRSRLHILGASGSGTTTLARAVADAWSAPHADADDYFWLPTDPPFVEKRPEADRVALMQQVFLPRDAWVLSGSMLGWGETVVARCDAVVFLTLDADERIAPPRAPRARAHPRAGRRGGLGGVPHLGPRLRRPDLHRPEPRTSRGVAGDPHLPGAPARQRRVTRGAPGRRARLGAGLSVYRVPVTWAVPSFPVRAPGRADGDRPSTTPTSSRVDARTARARSAPPKRWFRGAVYDAGRKTW